VAIERRYRDRTERSLALWRGFEPVLVDGNTRALANFPPHPLVLVAGQGPRVTDADGNEYFDLLNNYTALVHGNAHPELSAAASSVLACGTVFPAPHPLQARHAALVCERLSGAESVRYTNSGTEAAMLAVRAARAATGRDLVAKARWGYHGSWEGLSPNVGGGGEAAGEAPEPGIPGAALEGLRVFEFNDTSDLEGVCRRAGSDLAAIVLEPMLGSGGAVPATPEFMAAARRLADELGAVLVVDEVQTFRLGFGGMQSVLGTTGDLTVLGKLIGGGFPIGAVAGPRHLLDVFSHSSPRHVKHSGTFNGNLVSMAAGIRAMELLSPEAISRLNTGGAALADSLRSALSSCGLPGCVTGYGSMLNVHLGEAVAAVRSGSDARGHDARLMDLLHLALLNDGIFAAPRGFLNTSTVLSDDDLAGVEAAVKQAFANVAAEALGRP
jgi:glutamate-1-semialdehyde 2,1-aminomutase